MSQNQEKKEYTAEEKAAYRQMKFDRYNAAYEEAATEIAKGGEEKIKKAEEENKSQAILYTFYFMQDRNATKDTKGVKISFGDNVRMYDILTKGKGLFLSSLSKKFNKENEEKYRCGFFRRVNPDGNGFNEWNVYVSWKSRQFSAKPESDNDGFVQVGKKGVEKKPFEKKSFEKKPYEKKPIVKHSLFKEDEEKVKESEEKESQDNRPRHVHHHHHHYHGGRGFQGRGVFQGRGGRGGFHHRGPFMGRGRGGFQSKPQQQPFKAPTGPTWANKIKGGAGPLDKKEVEEKSEA